MLTNSKLTQCVNLLVLAVAGWWLGAMSARLTYHPVALVPVAHMPHIARVQL